MSYTVYMHTCPNGKRYIGITRNDVKRRWANGYGYAHNQHFMNAIKKYGWDNIKHKIMSNWHTQEEAENLERHLIETFKTNDKNYGYNKTNGGERNKVPNEETRKKLRLAQLGKKASEEAKKRMSIAQTGRKHTELTKKKISESNTGKIFSEEHRRNLGKWQKGIKKPYCSRRISDEQKQKNRERRLGVSLSNHTKEKISKSLIGNKRAKRCSVNQLSLCGEYIQTFESITDASKFLNHKSHETIIRVCKGKLKTACGYRWEYAEEQT